jgi:endonuclease/exonuclease/phosphatase family metal-dependent hydrolase
MARMRRTRRVLAIVAGIFLVVMSYRILAVYEFQSGECSPPKPRRFVASYPQRLRVMTYNIEGHATLLKTHHIEDIAKTILKYQPDLVAINEAHRGTWQARFGDHVEQLRRLTRMNGAFGRSYSFLGGDFGNAVLTRGEVLGGTVHDLPGTGEPRSVFETLVRVNGGVIELYVTHLAAWGTVNSEARDLQLQCLADHVRASGHPFILAGDINAAPDAEEVAKFMRLGLVAQSLPKPTPTHRVMEKQLDHILVSRGWRVQSAQVLDDGPSDHRPVLVELAPP